MNTNRGRATAAGRRVREFLFRSVRQQTPHFEARRDFAPGRCRTIQSTQKTSDMLIKGHQQLKNLFMSGKPPKNYKYWAIAAVVILLSASFLSNHLFRTPTPWAQIHPGMTRSNVLAIAGTPQQSGWPENVAETWRKGSKIMQYRLVVVYENGIVRDVCEGTWVPYYGWLRPRIETLPTAQGLLQRPGTVAVPE
jgi:hypothetical protein